ncbi:MAG TPA: hypothetical protein VFJ48_03915 [Casimicrobiaceae bacterium]|nr:hypothetical protein [Casimicrobiaceae bacterium]
MVSFDALDARALAREGVSAALATTTGEGISLPLHGVPWYSIPVGVTHL